MKINSAGNLVQKFVPSDFIPKDDGPLDPSPVGNLLRSSPTEFVVVGNESPARRRGRRRRRQNYKRGGTLFFDGFVESRSKIGKLIVVVDDGRGRRIWGFGV